MIYFVYCLLIIVFAYFGDRRHGGKAWVRVIPALLLIIIIGFRHYTVGVDSSSYRDLYYILPQQNYVWIEIGFDRLIRYLDSFGFEYNALFLSCIILTAIPMLFTLEKTSYYFESAILLYILTLATLANGMRQCIAVAFFFWGLTFIIERKIVPYILCLGVALLFHYSSFFLIPLYFILNRHFSKNTYIIIYVLSFIFCFVDTTSIIRPLTYWIDSGGRYNEHFDSYIRGSLSSVGFIYNTAINIFLFYLIIKTDAIKKHSVLANCSIITFIMKNISLNFPMIGRVSLYFAWATFLLMPYLIYENNSLKFSRNSQLLFIYILYLIGFIHMLNGNEMKMNPYSFDFVLKH